MSQLLTLHDVTYKVHMYVDGKNLEKINTGEDWFGLPEPHGEFFIHVEVPARFVFVSCDVHGRVLGYEKKHITAVEEELELLRLLKRAFSPAE